MMTTLEYGDQRPPASPRVQKWLRHNVNHGDTLGNLVHFLAALGFIAFVSTLSKADAEPADVVVRNGKIVTVDAKFSIVEAAAITDGRIVDVGSNDRVQAWIGPKTEIVELDGKMVLPGLIDSHVHAGNASMYEADHSIPSMDSIDDVLAYLRERSRSVPAGEWIVLSQVFVTRLREQRYPTRAELDSATLDHPVAFRTGPDASVNTTALKECGIDRAFAAKHLNHVQVDSTGEPTGILRQAELVLKTKPNSTTKQLSIAEQDDRLVMLLDDYNRWGITAAIDRNCSGTQFDQYRRLLQSKRLRVRMRLSRSLDPKESLDAIEKTLDAYADEPLFKQPEPRLGIIGVKVFLDGGMLTGSAYFTRPWGVSRVYGIDDPTYRGMKYIDDSRLENIVRACVKRNLAFTAHSVGDASVAALLNAYAKVDVEHPVRVGRSTITHSNFMSDESIAEAARLGIGVDIQPAWLYLDGATLQSQLGLERMRLFQPLNKLFDAGVTAGGGSDHMQRIDSMKSVNPYNPFLGMWITAARQPRNDREPLFPEQSLSRQRMIRFYTINNATLMRSESMIGSIEVGKQADFIIVDRNLLTCPVEAIRDTRVLATYLDGVCLKY